MVILYTLIEIVQPRFVNGYDAFVESYSDGLNAVVAALAAGVPLPPLTIEPLSTAIVDYIQPLYYATTPPLDQLQQLQAVTGNIYNAYVGPDNPIGAYYTAKQLLFMDQLKNGINDMPLSYPGAANFFHITGESIATSDLTTAEQAPLLMALAVAIYSFEYFYGQCSSPSTDWANFVSANAGVNFINMRRWLNAAVTGIFVGITQSVPVMPTVAPQGTGVAFNLVTALAGSLTTVFGEIVYGWGQKPLNIAAMQRLQINSGMNQLTGAVLSNSASALYHSGKTATASGEICDGTAVCNCVCYPPSPPPPKMKVDGLMGPRMINTQNMIR